LGLRDVEGDGVSGDGELGETERVEGSSELGLRLRVSEYGVLRLHGC